MSEKNAGPHYINNTPCGEDLFLSGAQEITAKSISRLIAEGRLQYRLIGLDGSWGTGKSNVISIIAKQLQQSHHVFVYDAWSHQEDLQRRSFLEELTDNLQSRHIIDQQEWREKLKSLLSRKKETIQQTVPKLSYAIIVASLATILTPVTTSISATIKSDLWKTILTLFPIATALIIWGIAAYKNKKYRKFTDLFYLYKEKDLETVTSEVVSESEPSVREFRNWMLELENAVKKDLIVVFDNMDRLPPEKVQVLWSSIHTFFSENSVHKKIWVIVPFDRFHISEAFSKEDEEKANHFINKTFPVIYRVSPALLTDWWRFFEIKFKEAFGDVEENEYTIVKGVFDRYHNSITPRQIIAFINELVTLKLTWSDRIPLRYMALFLANKAEILKAPVPTILAKRYRERVVELFADDGDIDDYIAALVYNIPKETATQVTLQREIVVAIRDENYTLLIELNKHPEFFKILQDVYVKEDMDLKVSVHCVDQIHFDKDDSYAQLVLRGIWTKLAIRQQSMAIDELEFTRTHQRLLLNSPELYRMPLIKHYAKQFSISRNMNGADFFEAMRGIHIFIKEHDWDFDLPEFVSTTSMKPKDFLEYMAIAKESYKLYGAFCDNGQLETYLKDSFRQNWNEISAIAYLKGDYQFETLLDELRSLAESADIKSQEIIPVYTLLKTFSQTKTLGVLIPDSRLEQLLGEVDKDSDEYFELAAMRIAIGDSFPLTGENGTAVLRDNRDVAIDQIAERITNYADTVGLLERVLTWKKPVLINILRKHIISASSENLPATVLNLLRQFNSLLSTVGVTDIELLTWMNGASAEAKEYLSPEQIQRAVPEVTVFESMLTVDNKFTQLAIQAGVGYLDNLNQHDWSKILDDESSYEFRLLVILLRGGKLSGLPNKVLEPYKAKLITFTRMKDVVEDEANSWSALYDATDKRQLKSTIKNVRDIFLASQNITSDQFIFFEECLRVTGDLNDRVEDVFRRIITPVLEDEGCLLLLLKHSHFYLNLFMGSGDERLDFLKEFRKVQNQRGDDQGVRTFAESLNAIIAPKLQITQATYFTNEHTRDVTEKLKILVEKQKNLHFLIDNSLVDGDDPHPGMVKQLIVKFLFDGSEYEHHYNEGDWINVP